MDTTDQAVAPAAPAESAPATEHVQTAPIEDGGETGTQAQQQEPAKSDAPPKPSRLQQRIDELTRQRYDEQRQREAVEGQLADMRRQQALAQQFSQLDAQAPKIDQFNSLHEYSLAMADWTTRRATTVAQAQWEERMQQEMAQRAQHGQRAMEQQQRTMRENVQLEEKMAAGAKKYPDFQQALMNPDLPSVRGTPLFEAVLAAEHAPDIAYALAKNPGELDRLLSIRDPMHIAREVFRLDAKFAGNGATSAPPPPPSRNGSTATTRDLSEIKDTDAWMRERERQIKARRGG